MIILTIIIQWARCQIQHNIWRGSHYSTSLTASKLITVCRYRTNVQWKSILPAEPLPTRGFHKFFTDLCLLFQVSCVSNGTQLSKLTNVLNALRNSPGTFGQSSSAIAKQWWNWQFRNATSDSDNWIPGKNNFTRRNLITSLEKEKNF